MFVHLIWAKVQHLFLVFAYSAVTAKTTAAQVYDHFSCTSFSFPPLNVEGSAHSAPALHVLLNPIAFKSLYGHLIWISIS